MTRGWVWCAVLMMAGCVSPREYRKKETLANQLQTEKQSLEDQLRAANGESTGLRQEKKALEENLAAARDENQKLLATLEAKKGELSKRVAELSRENQDLSQNLRETQQAKDAEIARMKGTYEQLVSGMKDEISAGQVRITQLEGKLTVNLVEKILFDSGRAEIKPEGRKVLERIGAILEKVQDKDIRIEGHTDNVPIGPTIKDRFPTNWELSTARATAVARLLQDKAGIAPTRLIAAGYGEYRPMGPNDTEESRYHNRRIEIVLVPRDPVATSVSPPAKP